MNIYHYHNLTKEYLSTSIAESNPEETRIQGKFVPLIPAYATLEKPPVCGDNEVAVYENGWVIKEDYRGMYKVSNNLAIEKITKLGEIPDIIIDEEMKNQIESNRDLYKIDNGKVVKKTEDELKQEEKRRISMLSLTRADVERALYKDKNIDFNDIINILEQRNTLSEEKIDLKALKIELNANNFFRGNPYVEQIGTILGYTSEQIDYLFQHKEFNTQ